jgi:hypothetical protein
LKFHLPAEIIKPELLQFQVDRAMGTGAYKILDYLFGMIPEPEMERNQQNAGNTNSNAREFQNAPDNSLFNQGYEFALNLRLPRQALKIQMQ